MAGNCNFVIFGFLCCSTLCLGYKIMIMCSVPIPSHYILCKAAAEILQERGHNVTLISAYSTKKSKFRDVPVPGLLAHRESLEFNSFDIVNMSSFDNFKMLNGFMPSVIEAIFNDKNVMKILNDESETFDVYMLEHFVNDALLGFGVKYKCPTIVLSPVSLMSWLAVLTDNPLSTATVPNVLSNFSKDMTLKERIVNSIMNVMQDIMDSFIFRPVQEQAYNTYFQKESQIVPYNELKNTISFAFINSHPSIGIARPLLPNTIEIGGFHISQPEPLPSDLKQILDSSKKGVIYFSMGSDLNSRDMDIKLINTILKVFATLKETVIWKFEVDIPHKPSNVIIKKWLPQRGILAHPNIKLFITHGGILSWTEATHFGVPLLAIPIFSDQFYNANEIKLKGQGIYLDYFSITDASLKQAIHETLNDTYAQNARNLRDIYNDRPMKPSQLLGYYVEHVIRTNGAKHLNPPRLPWYSLLLLDVALILFVPIFFILWMLVIFCKKCYNINNMQYKRSNKLKIK